NALYGDGVDARLHRWPLLPVTECITFIHRVCCRILRPNTLRRQGQAGDVQEQYQMAAKPALDFWCDASTAPMIKPHARSAGRVPQEDTGRATRQNVLSDIRLLPTGICLRFSRVGLS